MRRFIRGGGRLRRIVLVAGLWVWTCSAPAPASKADGGGPVGAGVCPSCRKPYRGHHKHPVTGRGSMGFQGFGLGYHPGYGYGGNGLGTGADGGYPFYGGPGYPHPSPVLRRLGGITPFAYFGGPCPGQPNDFGGVGPLAPDQPVVAVEPDPRDPGYTGDYGRFTGMIPYPETTFAPFETNAATAGSSAPGEVLDEHAAARTLGVDAEPVIEASRGRGLKINRVYPGSVAETAGLHVGDLIRSVNGFVTELPSNLSWILANASPDRVLRMSVLSASDGAVRSITARLP